MITKNINQFGQHHIFYKLKFKKMLVRTNMVLQNINVSYILKLKLRRAIVIISNRSSEEEFRRGGATIVRARISSAVITTSVRIHSLNLSGKFRIAASTHQMLTSSI